jgi:PTH1 family peptidyl-tRNA hydrolase
MHLVVGLGNPGREYQGNRHNAGFRIADQLAGAGAPWRTKYGAELCEREIGGERILICKPMQYMNDSGPPAASVAGFWKIPPERTVVAYDELDLPFGRLKLGAGGGAGGHNGVRSLMACLASPEFVRVRFGIGRPPASWKGADYVLSDFTRAEQAELPDLIAAAAEAVEAVITRGVGAAMNKFNVKSKNGNKRGGDA